MEKSGILFAGKLMVFGTDFRQVLPVSRNTLRGTKVGMILRNYHLSMNMNVLHASINDRRRQRDANEFSEYFLSIGEGKVQIYNTLGWS